MARTKRKTNILTAEPVVSQSTTKKYRAAGYARLSVEDSGKPGSETLESQKALISDYIQNSPEMQLVSLFYDNGRTGTDFHRPGFKALMEAVRTGQVNCIVVKDLSRFGRNYRETGNYLERIFPFLGVRFVAISDRYDTLTAGQGTSGYIVPLKNLINETYSRDISKKSAAALHTKQKRGEFIGTWAPYGYSKDPEDRHHLVPNPETAPIVQRIFRMRVSGASTANIARTLNREGIPSPTRYLVDAGQCKSEKYAKTTWAEQTIKAILSREVYLGHMVQGIKRQSFHDGQSQYHAPKEEWSIVRNTHEPIIDEATFATVQEMAQSAHKTYFENLGKFDELGKSENILQGLIYCADCGKPLVRYKSVSHGKKMWYIYICQTHTNDIKSCPKKSIREDKLFSILWEEIGGMKEAAAVDSVLSPIPSLRSELDQVRRNLRQKENGEEELYLQYVEKQLTSTEYAAAKHQLAADTSALRERLTELEAQIREQKQIQGNRHTLSSLGDGFELTRELLVKLIDRIEIGKGDTVSVSYKEGMVNPCEYSGEVSENLQ